MSRDLLHATAPTAPAPLGQDDNLPPPKVPAPPETRLRAVALLTALAAWVIPGIIHVGWVLGAPVTPPSCAGAASTHHRRRMGSGRGDHDGYHIGDHQPRPGRRL